jgi:hypothetical protein
MLRTLFIIGAVVLMLQACSSPLDLDVDRSKHYPDGATHPTRLSLYYYYGDSAYEAIVTDTTLLNHIWIERGVTQYRITVPTLEFHLPDTVKASAQFTPFVRSFAFSSTNVLCDGQFTMCTSPLSWIAGEFMNAQGKWEPFKWSTDTDNRQLRIAYYDVPTERLVKASLQILVGDPGVQRYSSFRALITLEY